MKESKIIKDKSGIITHLVIFNKKYKVKYDRWGCYCYSKYFTVEFVNLYWIIKSGENIPEFIGLKNKNIIYLISKFEEKIINLQKNYDKIHKNYDKIHKNYDKIHKNLNKFIKRNKL